MRTAQQIQRDYESGEPQEVVFNNNMVSLVRAAKVWLFYNGLFPLCLLPISSMGSRQNGMTLLQ